MVGLTLGKTGWQGGTDIGRKEGRAGTMGLTLERRKGCRGGTDIRKTKGLERWD